MRLVSDNSLMADLTGWRPRLDLEAGIAATVAWIEGHRDLYGVERYVV